MPETKSPLRGNDIRKRNEKLILNLIHKHKELSQSQAVNLTGLKPPTILRIFTNLETEKLIKINKKSTVKSEKKGRRPVFYQINSKAAFIVGVDFCSTSASVVIENFDKKTVFNNFIELKGELTGESVLVMLTKLINEAIIESGINPDKILGIGIGAPGRVDISSGTVFYFNRISGLSDYHLKDRMKEFFNVPIYVNNNCSVIAMNEYQYGAVSESNALITLLIRSGVGGAFINEGKNLTSNGLTAMEVGHICINTNGHECECGEFGCLESYLAEPAILKDLKEKYNATSFLEIDNLIKTEPEMDAYIREKAEQLTKGLKILVRSFSPDTFLLISRSALFVEKLAEYAQELLKEDSERHNSKTVQIRHVIYDPIDAGRGAADMVFTNYFSI